MRRQKNSDGTVVNNTETNNSESDSAGETTTGQLMPNIPAADYGGYEFKIFLSVNDVMSEMWNDFHAESENGDVINDAIYKRNRFVEDKYNVKIIDIQDEPSHGPERPDSQVKIKNSIQAGDHSYDAAMLVGYATCALTTGGFLMDMNNMAPLDLTQPWWDQKANRDLMIKNKMFYTTGDISNVVNEATYAILFNKN